MFCYFVFWLNWPYIFTIFHFSSILSYVHFIVVVFADYFQLFEFFVLTLILFFLFLSRIYSISKHAKDFYGTLVTTGFMGMLFYQILQNIGMTIGLMPVTGVTLPFVSYGGSSMLTTMMIIALIMNIYSKSHSSFAY